MVDAEKDIIKFLESNEDYSFLIEGKWGIGKTYLWKKVQKKLDLMQENVFKIFIYDCKKEISLKNHFKSLMKFVCEITTTLISWLCCYCEFCDNKKDRKKAKKFVYISLFGKEHYKQVLEEVLLKAYTRNRILLFFKRITLYGVSVDSMLSLLKEDDLQNVVVCFDDIERKSDFLKMKDFLGLVFQLKEEKQCKVVLLLNTEELREFEKKIFDSYKEKIIDSITEITDVEEAIKEILNDRLKDIDLNLMPKNIYNTINLRNLYRMIKGFRFFNAEFNLSQKYQNDKENHKDIIIYLYESVVGIINKTESNDYSGYNANSKSIINSLVEKSWNGNRFKAHSNIKEDIQMFDRELKNYKFYILRTQMKEIYEKFIKMNFSSTKEKTEIIKKYENIMLEIQNGNYIQNFVSVIWNAYDSFTFIDFMALISVIKSSNKQIEAIEKEIRKYILQCYVKIDGATEQAISMICGGDESLLKCAKKDMQNKANNRQIQNLAPNDKINLNQLLSNKVNSYNDFLVHLGVINDENNIYTDDEIKKFLKDNKIISFYLTYCLSYPENKEKVQNKYPRLYKIFEEIKN